jgi:hypothetical protein
VDEFHGGWRPALFTKTPAWFQSEQLFDGAAGGGNRILFKVTLAVLGLVLKPDFLQFALIILHRTQILPGRRAGDRWNWGCQNFIKLCRIAAAKERSFGVSVSYNRATNNNQ